MVVASLSLMTGSVILRRRCGLEMKSRPPYKLLGYVIFYLVAIWLLADTSDFNFFFVIARPNGFAGIMVFLTWGAEIATAMSLVAVPFLLD